MKIIANNASFWADNTHSTEFPKGPEKFGQGPISPQVAKPRRWFGMFHSQARRSATQLELSNHIMPGSFVPVDLDEVDLEIFDDCVVPIRLVEARITSVTWGEPDVTEIDDADFLWNALDSQAIGTVTPLETREIEVTIGKVRQGKPRAVAMDELDWEFLDFD